MNALIDGVRDLALLIAVALLIVAVFLIVRQEWPRWRVLRGFGSAAFRATHVIHGENGFPLTQDELMSLSCNVMTLYASAIPTRVSNSCVSVRCCGPNDFVLRFTPVDAYRVAFEVDHDGRVTARVRPAFCWILQPPFAWDTLHGCLSGPPLLLTGILGLVWHRVADTAGLSFFIAQEISRCLADQGSARTGG